MCDVCGNRINETYVRNLATGDTRSYYNCSWECRGRVKFEYPTNTWPPSNSREENDGDRAIRERMEKICKELFGDIIEKVKEEDILTQTMD